MLGLLGQAFAWLRFGDLEQAESLLARAHQTLPPELGPIPEAAVAGYSVACAHQQGRHVRAEELAAAAMAAIARVTWPIPELGYALCCILEVYLAEGRHERHVVPCRIALDRLHRIARRFPFVEPNAWMFHGRREWLQGRPERAATALQRSLRAAERLGSGYKRCVAHYWLGRLAQSTDGRRVVLEGADTHLRAAVALADGLGLTWEAARARAALSGALEGGGSA